MSSRSPGPSSIAVVAILTDGEASLDHTLEAVAAQTYESADIYLVGEESKEVADALGVPWVGSLNSMIDGLSPTVTHLWLLHAGAIPRPDALHALVFESERVDAGVAGSKLLDLENADRLVSVGIATDVFDVPYFGIDDDELDAGQYDVVRDVAAVGGASMLVRRDLLKGLGGPDRTLAPEAAAIDLSQRARALGARVVVVPSSEVAVGHADDAPPWREEAGRIRAMTKIYSFLTLLWALPLRAVVGLIEAILAPFTGRWTLLVWIRSWLWNLFRLPSTIGARRAARSGAVVGDAELFRFQVRGSAALRKVWGDLADAARARFPAEDRSGIASLAQEVRRPAFGVGIAVLLFSVIATRQLWSGFPAGGLSLPLPSSGAASFGAYAGGWNPAGFGSTEQLPPLLGLAGLWQQLWFDNAGFASGSLALLAFVGGIWGMARLLRTWSVSSVPAMLAGVLLMAGPAARTIAGSGDIANMLAVGVLPWAMRVAVAPWPSRWMARLGQVLTAGWVTALMANLSPDLLFLPVGALGVRALLQPKTATGWIPVGIAAAGSAIGLALLRPWVSNVDLAGYLGVGQSYWTPGALLSLIAIVAAAAAIAFAPDAFAGLAVWGSLLAAGGFTLARTASEGGGRHLEAVGLAAVGLGMAVAVGVVFESLRRIEKLEPVARIGIAVGALGAGVLVLSSFLVVGPGRSGLPADQLSDAIRFTGAALDDDSATRVLLIGPSESLPGSSRTVRGATYRVVSAPMPELWEVELPEAGAADHALDAVLQTVIDGGSFRAGQDLAEFGIKWVVEMGPTPLSSRLDGQLDLIPLDGLRQTAFLVDVENAVSAGTSQGDAWQRDGTGYVGTPAATVAVKEQAHPGWGADSDPADWSMTLDGSSGQARFSPGPDRDQALASLWMWGALILGSVSLRRWR